MDSAGSSSGGANAGGTDTNTDVNPGTEFIFEPIRPVDSDGEPGPSTSRATPDFPVFRNIAAAAGVVHVYDNGTTVKQLMTDSTGGGAGWLDFDLDTLPDLYLPQGGAADAQDTLLREPDSLYRQTASSEFYDVAAMAGVECREYGQGIGVADFNNDGFPDLLVTNVGENWLLINNGDGTFSRDVDSAISTARLWSSSCAWGDVDHDGDVDVYVCNYAKYDPYDPIECKDEEGVDTVCHPRHTPPEPDHFFLNNGDGQFTRADRECQLFGDGNRGLGVVIADLDRNGWQDIYVANDTTANFVFLNNGEADFQESALGFGGAVSAQGRTQASMGIAVGDYDGNGFLDICLTHFSGEPNTLYQNLGGGGLNDVSALTGLRSLTLSKLAFGAVMHDFDANGRQEMIFANGHIDPLHPDGDGYEIEPQMLTWTGERWIEWAPVTDGPFSFKAVGRGVALADFDTDGDTDLYIANQNSPGLLLTNESVCGPQVRLRLIGTNSPRDGTGAVVSLMQGDVKLPDVELINGYSFASAHENVLTQAVPSADEPLKGTVAWTSGRMQTITLMPSTATVTIIEGRTE